jgi:hypothetical protein
MAHEECEDGVSLTVAPFLDDAGRRMDPQPTPPGEYPDVQRGNAQGAASQASATLREVACTGETTQQVGAQGIPDRNDRECEGQSGGTQGGGGRFRRGW